MATEQCLKCKMQLSDSDFVICDCCNELLHEKCSELSTTEMRSVLLKKRSLMFFCLTCKENFKQFPKLIKNFNELMERNKALEETNKELLQKLDNYKELESKITTPIANQCNMEDVISEIIDRQSRATNVIIFNVNESSNNTKVGRLQDDREAVINILEDYAVDKTDLKLFRLGKISPNKMRPIKLTLKSAEEAKYILRNKLVKNTWN
ncbi:hypothetical protein NQ317_009263 [Molorchus minor]|uniref:Zinc finger PHD-type domain-containing protein n=1 Tax=Molorchus minor TaxID=1323400 RepID=A0ABQ9IVL3_9CUCU|nr:hypothetical protein NQ317_009263 [Molorchus minor]